VHQSPLVVFRNMVQELLNIEFFFQKSLINSKLNVFGKVRPLFLILLESPQ
jgi:hypothetical protein